MSVVSTGRLARLLREGRDEDGFGLSLGGGGWLIGWLDMVFITLGRSCPDTIVTEPAKITLSKNDRYETFLKSIKTYTPNFNA
jgi:hypothetical protein